MINYNPEIEILYYDILSILDDLKTKIHEIESLEHIEDLDKKRILINLRAITVTFEDQFNAVIRKYKT